MYWNQSMSLSPQKVWQSSTMLFISFFDFLLFPSLSLFPRNVCQYFTCSLDLFLPCCLFFPVVSDLLSTCSLDYCFDVVCSFFHFALCQCPCLRKKYHSSFPCCWPVFLVFNVVSLHVRHYSTLGRLWQNHDESISVRNARVQVWIEWQSDDG